jgi:DNA polymerase-3 subunit gamma/tau
MKALYRRYRPQSLQEVVAEKQVTEPLLASLEKGQIGHAYLFVGPRGCGKTSVARILAHQINGFKYELEDNYLDIIEIDAASNTSVDNIRELRERAVVAPVEGKYKVYIIDEVHMLSKSAFNALLKTLEEPPEHVVFIMATTDFQKVPATIVSRCQTYQFKLADESEMFEHLKKITKAEKIDIEDEALKIIINRGGGSFRDTLSLLDQISTISTKKISADSVREILGMPSSESVKILLDAYKSQDLDTIRTQIVELKKNNVDIPQIAEQMIAQIINKMDIQSLAIVEPLTEVPKSNFPEVKLLSILATPSIKNPVVVQAAPQIVQPKAPEPPKVTPKLEVKPEPKPEPKSEPKEEPAVKIETKPEPAAAAKPAESTQESVKAPEPAKPQIAKTEFTTNDELWQAILDHVKENACSIKSQMEESNYQIVDKTLTIYTGKKFYKSQIEKKRGIIAEVCPSDYDIVISEESIRSDETMANIAEIMGGGEEVAITE